MRILFYGSPAQALPFLRSLAREEECAAVVTRPDKPRSRGLSSFPTAVKREAASLGLKVLDPPNPMAAIEELSALKPDLGVAVAYGRLLRPELFRLPRLGTLNVHFSLLPRYRGAAPVAWSLINGETRSGVTVFWIDEGLDTGPILLTRETSISPDEDATSLQNRLIDLGVGALREALALLKSGAAQPRPQVGPPCLAPPLTNSMGLVSFEKPADAIHNLVRGLAGGPKAYVNLSSSEGPRRLILLRTKLPEHGSLEAPSAAPGSIARVDAEKGFLIECGKSSFLWIVEVQMEGRRALPAASFLNGLRLGAGKTLPLINLNA